jgi:2-dehydropantoate 2-reductase
VKITVYGAGAIGGYLAAELALAGEEVSIVARGPHLQAIRKSGLRLFIEGGEKLARVRATEDPAELGAQDYVILTLKAHSVTPVVEHMVALLGPQTPVVTAQNGILWWYFYGLPGPWENERLPIADPGGKIWDTLGPERAIGCVVYPSCEIVEPGVVRHIDGKRFMLGEPDGTKSERVTALSKILTSAGLKSPVRTRIRDDIWLKLWGNVSFNPVSAVTGATLEEMTGDPGTREVIRKMMSEAEGVARKLGVDFPVDVDTRIGWGAEVGAHKTSMLQDLEKNRPMEIDALVASVVELGRLTSVPTPTIDTLLALVRLRARTAGIPT